MVNVAAFLLPIKELNIIPVPQLTTTDCGVHWILPTEENGEIAVSTQLNFFSTRKHSMPHSHSIGAVFT